MRDKILELLPEINLIQDPEIKEGVIRTWETAAKLGGWDPDELTTIPFTLLLPDTPISLITHTRAVTNTAIKVAETLSNFYPSLNINMDYVIAGALLHDVGKLMEYAKDPNTGKVIKSSEGKIIRHPISGAALTYGKLPNEVTHIILAHSKEGDFVSRIVEAIIVHHSDFLNFEPFKK